jgi:hypothetical protein
LNTQVSEEDFDSVVAFYLENEVDLLKIKKTEGANFYQISKKTVTTTTKAEESDPYQMTDY